MAITNPTKYVSVRRLDRFKTKIEGLILKSEAVTGASVTKEISPNVFYSFGTVSSLTITLGSVISGKANEYAFEFDSGSTATSVSFPNTIVWQETPVIAANKHYEVSIRYDVSSTKYYGLLAEWTNA